MTAKNMNSTQIGLIYKNLGDNLGNRVPLTPINKETPSSSFLCSM